MRTLIILLSFLTIGAIASMAWRSNRFYPEVSLETVQLDTEKRHTLMLLRSERKFEAHNFPPLGYTGIATEEEGVTARGAVNKVIDEILAHQDGPLSSAAVAASIAKGMKQVDLLETEDRDRTAEYMLEIWYLLGFKGATGQFASGAGFPVPKGYGEPLPPGWKSPTEPRRLSGQ